MENDNPWCCFAKQNEVEQEPEAMSGLALTWLFGSLSRNKLMKICFTVFVLLIAAGCAPKSEGVSQFTLTTTAPAGLSDVRREAWKVECMVLSARLREIAFGNDARFRTTKIELRVDRSKGRIEVFVSDAAEGTALKAARAYAESIARVLELKRAEFEISPLLKIEMETVAETGS